MECSVGAPYSVCRAAPEVMIERHTEASLPRKDHISLGLQCRTLQLTNLTALYNAYKTCLACDSSKYASLDRGRDGNGTHIKPSRCYPPPLPSAGSISWGHGVGDEKTQQHHLVGYTGSLTDLIRLWLRPECCPVLARSLPSARKSRWAGHTDLPRNLFGLCHTGCFFRGPQLPSPRCLCCVK
jgi:hypothetical protein